MNDFLEFLPDPAKKDESISPDAVLNKLALNVTNLYKQRIEGLVFPSTKLNIYSSKRITYTFFLRFKKHSDYTYPLIEVECVNEGSTYPIIVSALNNSFKAKQINNQKDFEELIQQILKEEKTRNIILSMY